MAATLIVPLFLALTGARALSAETTLETDGAAALKRVTLPLTVPSHYPSASVLFDVSFATDERLIPGEFMDAFTMTLRDTNRAVVATVLTVDRFGVTWAPESPGALTLAARDLQFETISGDPSNFDFQVRFTAIVNLPAALMTNSVVLVLSLFDNQDAESSRAIVSNVRVRLGLGAPIALESSAAVTGGYALESGALVNRLRQTVTLPRGGAQRFYRLRGETASRIARLTRTGRDISLRYEAELGELNLRLEGANQPNGPFTTVTNAVFNLGSRTVTVPLLNAPGFFRMAGSHPARIISDEVTGEQRVLGFQVFPKPPAVESSAQASGPYADESALTPDGFAQTLTLSQGGGARFYRLGAEIPLLIRQIAVTGDEVVLSYEEP